MRGHDVGGHTRGKDKWETWGQSGDMGRERVSRGCKGTWGHGGTWGHRHGERISRDMVGQRDRRGHRGDFVEAGGTEEMWGRRGPEGNTRGHGAHRSCSSCRR